MADDKFRIGIIGGTGLDNLNILEESRYVELTTPFGDPSDKLLFGKIQGVECVILPRHDKTHSKNPSNVNYRANLLALKNAGCKVVIATTACGSLNESYEPGDVVILDDLIDRTHKRQQTYFDGTHSDFQRVCHIPMFPCFSAELRNVLIKVAENLNIKHHKTGTMITIEGPRFSSRSESKIFQSWGAHTINMTTCPEAALANELGLPYASLALVTDYDCWRDSVPTSAHVDVESVLRMFKLNINKVIQIVLNAIPEIAKVDWQPILDSHAHKVKSSIM